MKKLSSVVLAGWVAVTAMAQPARPSADPLAGIVQLLAANEDPKFQLDLLKGMHDGLQGRRNVTMPGGWEAVAEKLRNSPEPRVRELVQSLSLTFGSTAALNALRTTLTDAKAAVPSRSNALASLVQAKDPELAPVLRGLLKNNALQSQAIRAMASVEDAAAAEALLSVYPTLSASDKNAALTTLSSRPTYAKALLAAMAAGKVSTRDITADIVRQLRTLKDPELNDQVAKVWGFTRETDADKAKEIARLKELIKAKGFGDLPRGRVIYSKVCQQCHSLFGEGSKVGPELTGANRSDLDYVLQNIVDPNAIIPNDYRTWNVDTKDDRSITGIVTKQDDKAVTIVTATETMVIARKDVASMKQTELSLMPEGLLSALTDNEIRDLLAYLRSNTQVPMPAGAQ